MGSACALLYWWRKRVESGQHDKGLRGVFSRSVIHFGRNELYLLQDGGRSYFIMAACTADLSNIGNAFYQLSIYLSFVCFVMGDLDFFYSKEFYEVLASEIKGMNLVLVYGELKSGRNNCVDNAISLSILLLINQMSCFDMSD